MRTSKPLIMWHLELEAELLEPSKPNNSAYMVESGSHGASRPNARTLILLSYWEWLLDQYPKGRRLSSTAREISTLVETTSPKWYALSAKTKAILLVTRECTKQKKVLSNYVFVTSNVMVAQSSPMWTIDSATIEHVARD